MAANETAIGATLLPPFYRNFRKRQIKTPKLYFFDTGLVCHLIGILAPDQLSTHPLRGALFENWVFAELAKSMLNRGDPLTMHFWRTQGGQEIDFILEHGARTDAVEVKSGMTVTPGMIRSMQNAVSIWDIDKVASWVIYGGDDATQLNTTRILPWRQLTQPLHTL